MKSVFCLSSAAALLLLPLVAPADEKSHWMAAEELLEVMDMEALLSHSIEELFAVHMQQNPGLRPFSETVMEFFRKHMTWESLRDEFTTIYIEEFTEQELLELTTFYRTPTGQKAAQALPRLMAKGAQISRRRVEDNIDELRQLLALKAQEIGETTEDK